MTGFLRNRHRPLEPLWHVQLTMLVAVVLQLLLPDRYVFGSRYLLVFAEGLLLVALSFTTPRERIFKSLSRRINVLLLIGVSGLVNCYGLAVVASKLLQAGSLANGRDLILSAVNIYLTNIIIFGLFYWEMDGGGPGERQAAPKYVHDFLFPQNQNDDYRHPEWRPTFIDYLYVSSTNAMAFSPTDTLPLTRRAKLLMLGQAAISLVAIALVAARAVNILH
jgi:hypothetical protein